MITQERAKQAFEYVDGKLIWKSKTNKNKTSKNTTGVKGVDYRKNNGKYRAQIYNNKKCHNLGYYDTLEEAKEVVEKFRESLHKEFTNHG